MPDYNFENNEVKLEIRKAIDFWLERGVDGFRFDALKNIYGYGFDDFKYMVNKLHSFGIRVILDLVINHTSDQNPMFIDAVENTNNSKYRNWFILSFDDHSNQFGWHWKINSKD